MTQRPHNEPIEELAALNLAMKGLYPEGEPVRLCDCGPIRPYSDGKSVYASCDTCSSSWLLEPDFEVWQPIGDDTGESLE